MNRYRFDKGHIPWNKRHGMTNTKTYKTWETMIWRCHKNNKTHSKYYYLKGIKVCDRWKLFENFFEDMGEREEGMTIDRINTFGNYEPNNCRWIPQSLQTSNMRSNHKLTYNGKTQTMQQWVRETGINQGTLSQRINVMKWDVARALTTDPSIYKDR